MHRKPHSEETKRKISEAIRAKHKHMTAEQKEKQSNSLKKSYQTEKGRQRILKTIERNKSKENIDKVVATRKAKGNYKHTDATKQKLREANLGKKQSKEQCERQSARQKGRVSPNKGNVYTDAQRQRMSLALKASWEKNTEKKAAMSIRMSGKNNPGYIDGRSKEDYTEAFDEALKKRIHKRDGHACQECGKRKEKQRRKLSVHHIDYDKKNNEDDNLITLCQVCHSKTNHNRKYWQSYLSMKLVGLNYLRSIKGSLLIQAAEYRKYYPVVRVSV